MLGKLFHKATWRKRHFLFPLQLLVRVSEYNRLLRNGQDSVLRDRRPPDISARVGQKVLLGHAPRDVNVPHSSLLAPNKVLELSPTAGRPQKVSGRGF